MKILALRSILRSLFSRDVAEISRSFCREFTAVECHELPLERLFRQSMLCCSPFAQTAHVSRQNPLTFRAIYHYQQKMQHLDLARCYHTIFIPCGTIQLVVDRGQVFEALRRLHEYLVPAGVLVLTVYNRWREMEDEQVGHWTCYARHPLPDGSVLYKPVRVQNRNLLEQTLACEVRYRRVQQRRIIVEQR